MLILFLALFSLPAYAADNAQSCNIIGNVPVQHDGRIKPASSLARALLYEYSGHKSIDGLDAQAWMCETLFNPAVAIGRPLFRIFKPDLIGLPAKERPYYSLSEIAPRLQANAKLLADLAAIPNKDLNSDQKEIIRIKGNAESFITLMRSFSFLLPLQVNLPDAQKKAWGIEENAPFSLQDYKKIEPAVTAELKKIIRKKGENPKKYTEDELALTTFSYEMKIMEAGGQNNNLFRIYPGIQSGNSGVWVSPWDIYANGQGTPEATRYLTLWHNLSSAYLANDNDQSKKVSGAILKTAAGFEGTDKLVLERFYTVLSPLSWALGLYALSLLAYLLMNNQIRGPWRQISLATLWGGTLLNVTAVVLRVAILGRPPVGTLYESVLFVAMLAGCACLYLEHRKKDGSGLMTGSLCGSVLLFIAGSFADGDTLKVLVAVLNTNFWLTTHVLCITAGYAWCIVVSILCHLWLLNTARGLSNGSLTPAIKTFTLISLLFTAVGTILGGIWADQSWGRFWGWDPKENGALLIVLWLAWVLHAKISHHLDDVMGTAMLAALSIVVSLAWFGVNLLNVGLHSYGFISGMAYSLAGFIAIETLLICFLVYIIRKRKITV